MKTSREKAREAQADPEVIEKIVEDLSQQDVLPSDLGSGIVMNDDLEEIGEQAGHWDEPVGSQPHQVRRKLLEDETKSSEILVQRGVTEAENELDEMEGGEAPPEEGE